MYLGVDTSTKCGSVALVDDKRIMGEFKSNGSKFFSRSLLEMIDKLLSRNGLELEELSGLSITLGPGSFTGIRVGLATIQGIAISKKIPIFGVSSLEAMSRCAKHKDKLLQPMLDARKDCVYFAGFDYANGTLKRRTEDSVAPINEALEREPENTVFFGDGAELHEEAILAVGGVFVRDAYDYSIAAGAAISAQEKNDPRKKVGAECLKPNYIRRSPAEN
ncbi:MAG: tRNA (adenosine(37)-N6)-threonylcarbamoyltransferase complex dimerization subunit type 1 TsaB [bacterium]|nr:MAG: tRNA (adenosine(37)-N6)-threonylcarbamoyltransferase complex dimerization subunit type 1 TsaB [bacterium]